MLALAFAVAAAAGVVPEPPRLTADDVRAIRAACGLPESWIWYRAGEVHMAPPKDAADEKVDCMLREAAKKFPHIGFVGNEGQ